MCSVDEQVRILLHVLDGLYVSEWYDNWYRGIVTSEAKLIPITHDASSAPYCRAHIHLRSTLGGKWSYSLVEFGGIHEEPQRSGEIDIDFLCVLELKDSIIKSFETGEPILDFIDVQRLTHLMEIKPPY